MSAPPGDAPFPIRHFDRFFRYGHHRDAGFSLAAFEAAAQATGFRIERALRLGPMVWYRWRREGTPEWRRSRGAGGGRPFQ